MAVLPCCHASVNVFNFMDVGSATTLQGTTSEGEAASSLPQLNEALYSPVLTIRCSQLEATARTSPTQVHFTTAIAIADFLVATRNKPKHVSSRGLVILKEAISRHERSLSTMPKAAMRLSQEKRNILVGLAKRIAFFTRS